MKKNNILIILELLLLICSFGCSRNDRNQVDSSAVQGHFEDSDEQQLNTFKGQQVVPPEYSPVAGVIVSDKLVLDFHKESLIKAIFKAGAKNVWMMTSSGSNLTTSSPVLGDLRQALGTQMDALKIIREVDAGERSVWARDWAPLVALSHRGEAAKLRLIDLNYYPNRPGDDATARSLSEVSRDRISIPVYNEGGNFMINGKRNCLMTTRVLEANSKPFREDDMVLDDVAITQYYKEFVGCEDVTIFPRMPVEKTGHIDMWAKFLNDDTIAVSQISDETIATTEGLVAARAAKMQRYLEDRANDLMAMGYEVKRIPMPAPAGAVRSYTNSLFVNQTAIIPRYGVEDDTYPDQNLTPKYNTAVTKLYRQYGFKVEFIDADELTMSNGAIHCVTMQVPALN